MERHPVGDSGLEVSALALGTWPMSGNIEMWGHADDRESIAAIHQALDCGVNLIDTAPIYGMGHSEDIVGKAIQGRRHEVILATKCGVIPPKRKGDWPTRCLTRECILRECDASLRRMRTDAIDILQCHWPDPETAMHETMDALTTLLSHGKIRAIGLSNYGCEQIAAAREFGPIHCLVPPFSMLQPRAANDLIPYCAESGIAVIPYDCLAKGLLAGTFDEDSRFEDIRAHDPEFIGERYRRNLTVVNELHKIAASYDKTVAQLAINWASAYPGVTAVIVGAKRPSQVLENVGGIGWSISDEDRARIDSILKR